MNNITIANLTATSNPGELVNVINHATSGLFILGFLISFGVVLLFVLTSRGYSFDKSLASVFFSLFILSLFPFNAGWIDLLIPVFFLVGTAGMSMYLVFIRGK